MAKDQTNKWESAEKDLLSALQMQPHNAQILNFLAYSWAEKNIKLDKALEFIKKATALKPYDGSILDSYGWILFKQKKYTEAANILEEAVELLPSDPIILDHLGDAYWKANRENDARHYWRKASHSSESKIFKQIQ